MILEEHAGVKGAVVIVEKTEPGRQAPGPLYVVPVEGCALDVARLRTFLRPKVPSYMVPDAFVLLPGFPLTTSGKVNKRALPAPNVARTNKVLPIRVSFLQMPRENAGGIGSSR